MGKGFIPLTSVYVGDLDSPVSLPGIDRFKQNKNRMTFPECINATSFHSIRP